MSSDNNVQQQLAQTAAVGVDKGQTDVAKSAQTAQTEDSGAKDRPLFSSDWDGTVTSADADIFLQLFNAVKEFMDQKELPTKSEDWPAFIAATYDKLRERKIGKEAIFKLLEDVKPLPAAVEAIKDLSERSTVVIVSGGEKVLVKHIVQREGLEKHISAVIGNAGFFDQHGFLCSKALHEDCACQQKCRLVCKVKGLADYIASEKLEPKTKSHIGDGINDVGLFLSLSADDVAIAIGDKLKEHLEKLGTENVKAKLYFVQVFDKKVTKLV